MGKEPQDASVEQRASRMEVGAKLWAATYVPPIEPERRQKMIDKWSGNASSGGKPNQVSSGAAGTTTTRYSLTIFVTVAAFEFGFSSRFGFEFG